MEGDTEGRHTSLHRPGVALSSCSCPAPVLTTLFCPIYSGLAPRFCSQLPGALLLCEDCGFADFLDCLALMAATGPPAPQASTPDPCLDAGGSKPRRC